MDLLKIGRIVPGFELPDVPGRRNITYASFLRKRRIVILLPNDGGWIWLAGAAKQAREFAERDLTVLVLTRDANMPASLPGGFHVLQDADGAICARLGGTPAFYLVGKDTGIKMASRSFPTLSELFRTIDAMPMRAQETRERG